jgi:hypothetical protein
MAVHEQSPERVLQKLETNLQRSCKVFFSRDDLNFFDNPPGKVGVLPLDE